MTLNCLIVDDERPALKLLEAYIKKLPHLNLVAACENAVSALAALQKHSVDILFLDIQMPDLTGLELLQTLKNKPITIFTTAYREYAVEGFALDATDYLIKPFSFERFVQAVNKASELIQLKVKANSSLDTAIREESKPSKEELEEHFYVRTSYKMEKVQLKEILYVESMREYVSIFTSSKRYVVHQTMNKMAERLELPHFMRVHRSYIVSMNAINAINGNTIQISDKVIPIGGSYRKTFFEQIDLL